MMGRRRKQDDCRWRKCTEAKRDSLYPSSEGWDMLTSAGVQRRTNFSEEDGGAILLSDSKSVGIAL